MAGHHCTHSRADRLSLRVALVQWGTRKRFAGLTPFWPLVMSLGGLMNFAALPVPCEGALPARGPWHPALQMAARECAGPRLHLLLLLDYCFECWHPAQPTRIS